MTWADDKILVLWEGETEDPIGTWQAHLFSREISIITAFVVRVGVCECLHARDGLHSSLYFLLPYPYLAPPTFPGNHLLVLYISESASFFVMFH